MNPIIKWQNMRNQRYLLVNFDGHLSPEDAQRAIGVIHSMIDDVDGKCTMVWECTGMAGYDTGAREAWQVFMKNIKQKVEAINVVSGNVVIRTGAMVVGMFAGIKIFTWTSLDDFQNQG